MWIAGLLIWGQVLAAMGLSHYFFRRYRISRPPIGVLNGRDLLVFLLAIVLMPYLYLALPAGLTTLLLGLGLGNLLYLVWEAIWVRPLWVWCATLLPLAVDVAVAWGWGGNSLPFFLVNNLLLLVAVVGLANLWAQAGLRAANVALLAGLLAAYDFVATTQLPVMLQLIEQLGLRPFAPLLAWTMDQAPGWLGLGLGDLILAALTPLVLDKAFGRAAGLSAALLNALAIAAVIALPLLVVPGAAFPVMVVLGPSIVAHYLYWRVRQGDERPLWRYWQTATRAAGG